MSERPWSKGPWINCNSHVDDSHGIGLFRSVRKFEDMNCYDFGLAAAAPEMYEACEFALAVLYGSDSDKRGAIKALEEAISSSNPERKFR